MVFNVLGANVDDHQKHFFFMMSPDGRWKVSLAYDITFTVDPDTPFYKNHELTVLGKRKNITRQDLLDFVRRQDIMNASAIIDKTAEVITRFKNYAGKAGVNSYWTD